LPEGLERVAEFGDDLLVKVTVPPIENPRERLFDTTKTLHGTPLEPLGDNCPTIRLRYPPVSVWKAGALVPISIEIENQSAKPWPGFGLVPRYLVRASACVGQRNGPPCRGLLQPLPDDVPAHGTLRMSGFAQAPVYPGEYDLHLRLVQVGIGSLEDCGVEALVLPIVVEMDAPKPPKGSYFESCRECRYDGPTFICLCLDGQGGELEVSTQESCPKGYANYFGRLVCEGTPLPNPPG
jgi:hypothetical protein